MKFVAFILGIAALITAAGFTFVALKDVPVEQTEIVKTIPNERFFQSNS